MTKNKRIDQESSQNIRTLYYRKAEKRSSNIKAEKKINTKEGFQCFYSPVIVIDSIYTKYENYYLKVFLKYPDESDEEKISELISKKTFL